MVGGEDAWEGLGLRGDRWLWALSGNSEKFDEWIWTRTCVVFGGDFSVVVWPAVFLFIPATFVAAATPKR